LGPRYSAFITAQEFDHFAPGRSGPSGDLMGEFEPGPTDGHGRCPPAKLDSVKIIDTVARIPGHAALALCKVSVVLARPWACLSRSRSSASRTSIARRVRTRYTVFCIFR
jgi:hypothetical protein